MPTQRALSRSLDHLPALLAVLLVATAIALSRYGLDLVDEAYFLSLIADPGANRDNGEIFLFGFLVHPLFTGLGGDVALLRLVGLLLMAAIAGWMAHVVLEYAEVCRAAPETNTGARRAAVLVVAASVVSAYATNVRVPNYRTITLMGLMLLTIALVWAARGHTWRSGLLIGGAWWLTVVARPTTGLALLVLVPGVLLAMKALTLRVTVAIALGGAVAAITTMFAARMDPLMTASYLYRGYTQNQLLGGHSSLRAMLGLVPPHLGGFVALGLPVLVNGALVFLLIWRRDRVPRLVIGSAVVWFVVVLVAVVSAPLRIAIVGDPAAALPMALIIPAWALTLFVLRGVKEVVQRPNDKRAPFIVGLLASAPYIASVGTNSPFTHSMALASTFWVLAAVLVSRWPSDSRFTMRTKALLTTVICLSVPATLLAVLAAQVGLVPGGGSLRSAKVAGGTLQVSTADATVLDMLSNLKRQEGITERTPVVDLTGIGSGYRFQLGPHPAGRAFLFGIFPGAEEAARYSLSWETCEETARAWLIYAGDNPWDVSNAFTRGVLDLDTDYQSVATFLPTQGPSSWSGIRMEVLKPTSSVARKLGC